MQKEIERLKRKQTPTVLESLAGAFIVCAIIVLIWAYISFLCGSDSFLIANTRNIDSIIIDHVISFLLCSINLFFVIGITTLEKPKKALQITIVSILLVYALYFLSVPNIITTFFIPLALILIYDRKTAKQKLFRYIALALIMFVYQFVSAQIKLNLLIIDPAAFVSTFGKLFYQIDQYIFCAVLYMKGLCRNELIYKPALELAIFPENINHAGQDDADKDAIRRYQQLTQWQRIRTVINILAFQVFQLFCVLAVSCIGNRLIECVIILIGFCISGFVIRRRWHSKSLLVCTLAAIGIFYIASVSTLPVTISILFPLLIGLLITYALYRAALL